MPETGPSPNGDKVGTYWRELDARQRVGLLLGSRRPGSKAEARTALAFARHLRRRSLQTSLVSAAVALATWVALSMVLGGTEADGDALVGRVISGVVFTVVFFVSSFAMSRAQAGRLERRAREVLDHQAET